MKRIKSIRGIELYEDASGQQYVAIRVYYSIPKEKRSRSHYEFIGPSVWRHGRNITLSKARRRRETLQREIRQAKKRGEVWLPPKKQEEVDKQQADQEKDARKDLLFENAVDRFLEKYGDSYRRPKVVRQQYENFLSKAFSGRHLDEITRQDVWQYRQDRRNATGPFEGGRKGGLRPVETDLSKLSALYSFLIYEERRDGLINPCSRPAGFRDPRKRLKGETYKPQHKAVVPAKPTIAAIFDAVPTDDTRYGKKHKGRQYRALFKLLYYTGARPESEACALRHGDVQLPDRKVTNLRGEQRLGHITFRDTKTQAGERTLPLHPELVEDLEAIMDDCPTDPAERRRWEQRPIFRQRAKTKMRAMTKDTYRKVWASVLEIVTKAHPDASGMWVRDLRKVFATYLHSARVAPVTIDRMMGHSLCVSGTYNVPLWEDLEDAISNLSLHENAANNVGGNVGGTPKRSQRHKDASA